METVIITGGTGMIGKALSLALLERGFRVIILTRNPAKGIKFHKNIEFAGWDIEKEEIEEHIFSTAESLIHLAGASVAAKRWTPKRKKEIISSRVDSAKLLVKCMQQTPNKIRTVISMSAIGYYGADKKENPIPFKEDDPVANNFLGQTALLWEKTFEPVTFMNRRLVKFRTGIVLSNEGGALPEFRKYLKFGLATILGTGNQVMSWIHIDDLVRMFLYALDNEKISGTYNAVSPNPVTNKELVLQLAKESNRIFIPVYAPSFILKLILGEMSIEVLKSATVSAEKISDAGFLFQYPNLETAIKQLTE